MELQSAVVIVALSLLSSFLGFSALLAVMLAWRARSEAKELRARFAPVEAEIERLRSQLSSERRAQLDSEWHHRPVAEEEQWTERFPVSEERTPVAAAAVLWPDSPAR